MNIQKSYSLLFKAENSHAANVEINAIKAFFFLFRIFQLFEDTRVGCYFPLDLAHIVLLGAGKSIIFLLEIIINQEFSIVLN